jgi:phage tail sheath protein FI
LKEALAQAAHGLFASAPAKPKTWEALTEDMRTKYREQFAAPLVAGILPIVQSELDCKSVVHACCEQVENVRKIAKEWAEQPTDYDEDTEQQIDDGNMILAALEAVK